MKNLTLLIPTKNRHLILKKTLTYYINNKLDFKILILDSSNKKNFELNKKFIKNHKYINHFKMYRWTSEVLKKSKKYIKSDYISYSGDDDIFCIKNLKYFINFLENNKNYIGIHGKAITADFTNGFLNYTSQYKFNEIKRSTPSKRLEEFFQNYTTLMFSITRKNYFFKAMDLVPSNKNRHHCPDKGMSTEIVPCAGLAFYGKFKNLNIPYLVRVVGHRRTFLKKKIDNKSINFLINIFKKKIVDQSGLNFFNNKTKKTVINKYKKINSCKKNNLLKEILKLILSFFFLKNFTKKILNLFNPNVFSREYIFSTNDKQYKDFKLILNSIGTR